MFSIEYVLYRGGTIPYPERAEMRDERVSEGNSQVEHMKTSQDNGTIARQWNHRKTMEPSQDNETIARQ
jgi:hypothetical protein